MDISRDHAFAWTADVLEAIVTPSELKSARKAFGLSTDGFASWVNVAGGRVVRRWEAGERAIPGPVKVLVKAAMKSREVRWHFGLVLSEDYTEKTK